ncbi:MAG: hypothetical protein ABL998_15600, partial [Planctomycetota bacterium]
RGVDHWQSLALLAPLAKNGNPWEGASDFDELEALSPVPVAEARFGPLPPEAQRAKTFESWSKSLALHVYAARELTLTSCPALKLVQKPDEPRALFLARLRQAAREARDREVEALRARHAPKFAAAQDKLRRVEERLRKETAQYEQQKSQSAISIGATLLGALFGRKLASSANVGKATTAARGLSRAAKEKDDLASAEQERERARADLATLEATIQKELDELGSTPEPEALGLVDLPVKPRKSDTLVERLALVWVPTRG